MGNLGNLSYGQVHIGTKTGTIVATKTGKKTVKNPPIWSKIVGKRLIWSKIVHNRLRSSQNDSFRMACGTEPWFFLKKI